MKGKAMAMHSRRRSRGFLILESLVALLVMSLGLVGMATLLTQVTGGAGDAKARSEAMALARSQLDGLRTQALQSDYTSNVTTGSRNVSVGNLSYALSWSVSQPDPTLVNRLVQVQVTWTDRAGQTRAVNLNSLVAWNDPVKSQGTQTDLSTSLVRPTGGAQRGTASYRPGDTTILKSGFDTSDKVTRLTNQNGTILYLGPDSQGNARSFTVISGRVYFDIESNQLPAAESIYLRLSSEGQCVFDNRTAKLKPWPEGASSPKYRYFSYTCYVGPGWYGNVGVTVTDANANPTICVGDPRFTQTNFTASPAAIESATRSYRGFRASTSTPGLTTYISTGMAASIATTNTPTLNMYGKDDVLTNDTSKSGKPVPADYPGVYGNNPSQSFFNQDFLVSKITGTTTCADRMQLVTDTFTPNAGKNYCINPDNWPDSTGNKCPATWPGSQSGTCSVTVSGSYNPPAITGSTLIGTITSTTSATCVTGDGSACSCTTTPGSANYSCSLTSSTVQSIAITGTTVSRDSALRQVTRSCTRTLSNLGCSSLSGFNIDSSTASPPCSQTTP